jgi:hypothetical protein
MALHRPGSPGFGGSLRSPSNALSSSAAGTLHRLKRFFCAYRRSRDDPDMTNCLKATSCGGNFGNVLHIVASPQLIRKETWSQSTETRAVI